jgi:hypothetical protein
MKTLFLKTTTLLFALGLMWSCSGDPKQSDSTISTIQLNSKKIAQSLADDGTRNSQTADVRLSIPYLVSGSPELDMAIGAFSLRFHKAILLSLDHESDTIPLSMDTLVSRFFQRFVQTYQNNEAGYFKSWLVETQDTVFGVSSQAVCVGITAECYTEGSQPDHITHIENFDPITGKTIEVSKIITDIPALQQLCEQKFKQVEADAFQKGFQLTDFKLPENIGITPKGLLFHYNIYEVGGRGLGDTQFLIPYNELKEVVNLNIGKP